MYNSLQKTLRGDVLGPGRYFLGVSAVPLVCDTRTPHPTLTLSPTSTSTRTPAPSLALALSLTTDP